MSDTMQDQSVHFFLGPILTLCGTHRQGQLLTRTKERTTCPMCTARLSIYELSFNNHIVRHVLTRFERGDATWEQAMHAAVIGLVEWGDRNQKEVERFVLRMQPIVPPRGPEGFLIDFI